MATPKKPTKIEASDLIWADPMPLRKRGKPGIMDRVGDALRSRPGKWAVIRRSDASHQLARHLRLANPGFEVVAQGRKLFARFVGERSCVRCGADQGNMHRPPCRYAIVTAQDGVIR